MRKFLVLDIIHDASQNQINIYIFNTPNNTEEISSHHLPRKKKLFLLCFNDEELEELLNLN